MDVTQMIERWGFPVAFAVWLMFWVMRDLREIRTLLHKQVVLNAVILKTLDVPGGVESVEPSPTPREG